MTARGDRAWIAAGGRGLTTAAVLVAIAAWGLATSPTAGSRPTPPEGGPGRSCDAMTARGTGTTVEELVTFSTEATIEHPNRYGRNTALWTSAAGVGCRAVVDLMAQVLLARDERVALELAGWRVTRTDRLRIEGVAIHQTWAAEGNKKISYARRGGDLLVSETVYRPGQALRFPRTDGGCTAGFALELPTDDLPLGLAAGHCSDYPFTDSSGTWQTEQVERVRGSGASRKEEPLGSVLLNGLIGGGEAGPDALIFALDGARYGAQQIERGSRPLLDVAGWLPTAKHEKGRTVCFFGRMTGERCGKIDFTVPLIAQEVICVQLKRNVIPGDSGGPVYTRPADGHVQAVGVVLGSIDVPGPFYDAELCYTPIERILQTFGARLRGGSFEVPPTPPPPPG
jgi:hypothetical protein